MRDDKTIPHLLREFAMNTPYCKLFLSQYEIVIIENLAERYGSRYFRLFADASLASRDGGAVLGRLGLFFR